MAVSFGNSAAEMGMGSVSPTVAQMPDGCCLRCLDNPPGVAVGLGVVLTSAPLVVVLLVASTAASPGPWRRTEVRAD